jgi:type IV fimbrial biogenesis protein FimT
VRSTGFTLIELLATIVVLSLLLGVGLPDLQRLLQDNRLVTVVNQLSRTLALTRSEAVAAGHQAVVCKSPDGRGCRSDGGWQQGWMVFVDPDGDEDCPDTDADQTCDDDGGRVVLIRPGSEESGVAITATGNPQQLVVFGPLGYADGYPGTFSICDQRGLPAARGLVLSMTGRIRVATAGDNLKC